MIAAWARRAAVLLGAAALAWTLAGVAHLDPRLAGALAVALETAVLAALAGRSAPIAAAGGALAGGSAALALWYCGAVLGPAYPAVEALAKAPWPAVGAAIAFGLVALVDVRRPASSAPAASP